ncbi:hypothetical protein HXX76_000146 [Chlamydomonas incerta]|uniref:carotenoid 9,10-dioxygenase n=1 Tax=Chlamydomonas incerta TaxID=51695 RepID=A0A835WDZ9_CHLIN|nr:hypothetical protein HXX76_000146 [Chlamydomonas incerta]|eukprot:KAG2445531.1 hypothetical protein HXX76_000146 [Chlamydomonas incerta]
MRATAALDLIGGTSGSGAAMPLPSAAAAASRTSRWPCRVEFAARTRVRTAAAASPTPASNSPSSAAASSIQQPSTSLAAGGHRNATPALLQPSPWQGFPPSSSPTSPAARHFLAPRRDGSSGSPPRARGGGPGRLAVAATGGGAGGGSSGGGSSSGPAAAGGSSTTRRGSVMAAANSGAAVAYSSQTLGMSSAGAAARRRFAANRRNGGGAGNSNNPLVLLYDRAAAAVGDLTNATSNVLPSLFDMMDTLEFEITELAGQLASSLAGSGLMDAMGLLDGGSTGGMENELGDLLGQLADAVVAASEGDYSKLLLLAYITIAVGWSASRPPPSPYLAGNYGPVHDTLRVADLPILNYHPAPSAASSASASATTAAAAAMPAVATTSGALPEGLPDGYYVRAGPNPYHKPAAGYHWFDGDGMLHGVRLRRGAASYANAWVDTERLQQERALGHPMLFRIGDMVGVKGIALMMLGLFAERMGTVHLDKGTGTANTALAFHAGRLLALHDDDLPYAVRVADDGGITTTGRVEYTAAPGAAGAASASKAGVSLPNLVSHPKIDPVNGDLLFVSNQFQTKPYTQAGVIDKHGQLSKLWPLDLDYAVVMHDMAATQKYIIVMHLPLCVDPKRMVQEDASPVCLRRDLPNRIGLLRRDAAPHHPHHPHHQHGDHHQQQAVQWFEVPGPGFGVFHVVNAWDEGDTVKLYACQQDNASMDLGAMDCARDTSHLTEYCLDMRTGAAAARRMSAVSADFPVVAASRVTLRSRYSWMAMLATEGTLTAVTGIAKMDLAAPPGGEACVAAICFPPGWSGGEAVFVPRERKEEKDKQGQQSAAGEPTAVVAGAADADGEDPVGDDGFLLVYVYSSTENTSYLHVYDARTMSPTPLAAVRLPRRVPYGFHGAWVTEEQLQAQMAAAGAGAGNGGNASVHASASNGNGNGSNGNGTRVEGVEGDKEVEEVDAAVMAAVAAVSARRP